MEGFTPELESQGGQYGLNRGYVMYSAPKGPDGMRMASEKTMSSFIHFEFAVELNPGMSRLQHVFSVTLHPCEVHRAWGIR